MLRLMSLKISHGLTVLTDPFVRPKSLALQGFTRGRHGLTVFSGESPIEIYSPIPPYPLKNPLSIIYLFSEKSERERKGRPDWDFCLTGLSRWRESADGYSWGMPKKSEQARLASSPTSWPLWAPGRPCKVFMGYGWATGTWEGLQGACGRVRLPKDQRTVIVRDARNVQL